MQIDHIRQKAARIKLLILDIDGVMTDGAIIFQNGQDQIKAFNVQDGLGIQLIQKAGIPVAIITGKDSEMVNARAQALGIKYVYQKQRNKLDAYHTVLTELSLTADAVCYVGDDLPDLYCIQQSGLGIAVNNAQQIIKNHADWTTTHSGGHGAVREICNLLLQAHNKLNQIETTYLKNGSW